MLNLQKRINGVDEDREYTARRIDVRDKLLSIGKELVIIYVDNFKLFVLEIGELQERLKELPTCRIEFPNPKQLHEFYLKIAPTSGYYKGGVFKFHVTIPPEYNNVVCFISSSHTICHRRYEMTLIIYFYIPFIEIYF